jgi:hypothetical protein
LATTKKTIKKRELFRSIFSSLYQRGSLISGPFLWAKV